MTDRRDWERLSDYVVSWRARRDISRSRLAELMGVSTKTVERIENAEPVRTTSLARLEYALGWKPGSARAVLEGGEPTLDDNTAPEVSVQVELGISDQNWRDMKTDLTDEEFQTTITWLRKIQTQQRDQRVTASNPTGGRAHTTG